MPIKVFGSTALHGFSEQLIEDISENCDKIFTVEELFACGLFP